MQCREGAVPNSRRRHKRWEEDEVVGRGSIEQSHDRSQKKPDGRPSPEQMNS